MGGPGCSAHLEAGGGGWATGHVLGLLAQQEVSWGSPGGARHHQGVKWLRLMPPQEHGDRPAGIPVTPSPGAVFSDAAEVSPEPPHLLGGLT